MPRIVVDPGAIELDVAAGETLLEAANRQGWYWPTSCLGAGLCNRCFFTAAPAAGDAFAAMDLRERAALAKLRWRHRETPGERLGCMARVVADGAVTKPFVRPLRSSDPCLEGTQCPSP